MADETGELAAGSSETDDNRASEIQPFRKAAAIDAAAFEDFELKALERLEQRFLNQRNDRVSTHSTQNDLGIPDSDVAVRVFARLKAIGAIEEHDDTSSPFSGFAKTTYYAVSPKVSLIAAARKAEVAASRAPEDRVSAAERWMRTHRFWSLGAIAVLVLYFISGLLKNLTDLIDWALKTWKSP